MMISWRQYPLNNDISKEFTPHSGSLQLPYQKRPSYLFFQQTTLIDWKCYAHNHTFVLECTHNLWKQRGKYHWDLDWENQTYKLKKSKANSFLTDTSCKTYTILSSGHWGSTLTFTRAHPYIASILFTRVKFTFVRPRTTRQWKSTLSELVLKASVFKGSWLYCMTSSLEVYSVDSAIHPLNNSE